MNKKSSRLTKALLDTAKDMLDGGILEEKEYKKITMRHLGKESRPKIDPMTSEEICALREKAHLSQAAFASYLNLTVGYISQLERGLKKPTGAALALLNVVRRKGFDAILR
jgi:putative transcriptional regulator